MVRMVIDVEQEFAEFVIDMAAKGNMTTGELIMNMCAECMRDALEEFNREKPKEVS